MAAPTVSVIIPAYTLDRWPLIRKAVESARSQSLAAEEVVLCIDNNDELLKLARREWASHPEVRAIPNRHDEHLAGTAIHVRAHGSARRFGAGSARNTAAEQVSSDVIAFMDDDAWAEPDWLAELLGVYENPSIVAVGGRPVPAYQTGRPAWFPRDFDWVFGCAYEGLPTMTAPARHLIGANLSVRREALNAVGGFQSVDFDDLDLCMRLGERYGARGVCYAPRAVVHHHVPADRVTWRYFYRRCFFVNREKVRAFDEMGSAANLAAEREFVWRALLRSAADARCGLRGDRDAFRSVAARCAGIALAGLGHLVGRAEVVLERRRRRRA
jgi:cellulose synthase/poly-beta-1,6-N-acetylglucosamine synthase-like glycosyltransferase